MRIPGIVTLILLLVILGAPDGSAQTGGVECVKTQCEGKGRTCVQTLYAAYEVCRKAANKKCNRVQPAEKFNCLTSALKPCALTRNDEQAKCLGDVKTCHAACGPLAETRTAYWCVGDLGDVVTAAFCSADMASASPMEQCKQAMYGEGPLGSMTCDPL